MNFVEREFHRAEMERAVLMPRVAEGERLAPPVYEVRPRKGARWKLFKDNKFVMSTGEKTKEGAERWLKVYLLQREAEDDAIYDVRRASAAAILDHRFKAVDRKRLVSAPVIKSTLKALAPYLQGKQLRDLTDDWVEEVEDGMAAAGYSYEYFCNAIRYFTTGVRDYTKRNFGAIHLPFGLPPSAPGRVRVLKDAEDAIVQRWSTGTEAYDPRTGVWTAPTAPLSVADLRDRALIYRQVYLGKRFGSRSGIYDKLSWEPHADGGHFDLDRAVFHRVPPGAVTAPNKLAPPVAMPEEVVAELRRWREQDGGNPWVFRTLDGKPLRQDHQARIFKATLERLGIADFTGHCLRHTCITRLIEKGVSARVISAVCGISIKMLHKRYDHSDRRILQVMAHDAIVSMG